MVIEILISYKNQDFDNHTNLASTLNHQSSPSSVLPYSYQEFADVL